MSLLTEALVREAIHLALPTIERILSNDYCTWGPRGVAIVVNGKGLLGPVTHVAGDLNTDGTWSDKRTSEHWNFQQIALQKMLTASRGGAPSVDVVENKPWLLEEGDSFYQGAVAEDDGLIVAVSGAYGQTDQAIAWIIWNLIWMLCALSIRERRDRKLNRL